MNEQQTEAAITAAGKTAPRVTPADLDAEIAAGSVHYFTALNGASAAVNELSNDGKWQSALAALDAVTETLSIITICVIVLANGFKLIGYSAPVSSANFDAKIGQDIAFRNAREQLWPLLGFRLADKQHVIKTLGLPPDTKVAFGTTKLVDTRVLEPLDIDGAVLIVDAPRDTTWRERLTEELDALGERHSKLCQFLASSAATKLPVSDILLLEDQRGHMEAYIGVLRQRVERAKEKQA